MPRQCRYFIRNILQHVITRGVDQQAVFFHEQDYTLYLKALQDAAATNECLIHAYVLMTNHVHLLVTPGRKRSLPLMMQAMGRNYVLRLTSLIILSDDDGRPAGFCLISTPQVRMNKNTLLNQNQFCPIGADVIQSSTYIRLSTYRKWRRCCQGIAFTWPRIPYYHPERLLAYATERSLRERRPSRRPRVWI